MGGQKVKKTVVLKQHSDSGVPDADKPTLEGDEPTAPVTEKKTTSVPTTTEELRAALAEANARAKDNKVNADKFTDLQEAAKDDLTKANDRADLAEANLAEAKLRELRREVSAGKKLPASLAGRLTGTTREEMEADADSIIQGLGDQLQKPPVTQIVTGAGVTGGGKTGDVSEMSPAELVAMTRSVHR